MQKYDCIVVGCGFAGAVAARELAEKKGKKGIDPGCQRSCRWKLL